MSSLNKCRVNAINLSFFVRATIKDCPYDGWFCRGKSAVALKLMALKCRVGRAIAQRSNGTFNPPFSKRYTFRNEDLITSETFEPNGKV